MSEANRLTIGRLRNVYLVPRGHPDPYGVRDRLDVGARARLAAGVRLASVALPCDDRAVWLIRRLDLAFGLDSSVDEAVLARVWSERLVAAVAKMVAAGPDGDTVLYFPDRSAYLARFLTDLAAGRARGRWYYAEFESLAALPPGAIVREALARAPASAADVLLQLRHEGSLEPVLVLLTAHDARVLCDLLDLNAHLEPGAALDRTLAAWGETAFPHFAGGVATPQNVLRLWLSARHAGAPSAGLRRAAEILLNFAESLGRSPELRVLNALAEGGWFAAVQRARAAGAGSLLESLLAVHALAAGEPERLCHVARTLAPCEAPTTLRPAPIVTSPFAGLLLVWPSFLALGLAKPIDPRLRFLVALKLLGRARAVQGFHDLVPLLAAGIDHPPPPAAWGCQPADWLAAIHRQLLRALASGGWIQGRCLAVECPSLPDGLGEILLLRDVASDTWVYAKPLGDERPRVALDRGLAAVAEALGTAPAFLLRGPTFVEDLPPSQALTDDLAAAVARYTKYARPVTADLAFLTLAGRPLPPGLDLALDQMGTLLARAVLRIFAARFRGFAWSSAEYLYQNFLSAAGWIRTGDEGEARLRCPPLHVILRMAGAAGGTIPLTGGERITLSLEPD
jgi:hypothetical protein